MERIDPIRRFLRDDFYEPTATGTFIKYFLLLDADVRLTFVRAERRM